MPAERDVPLASILSVSENSVVRITGTVRPLENLVLTAPLSGRRCVYWSVDVTEVTGSQRHDQGRGIGGEQAEISFILDDNTAQAVIDPACAEVSVPFDHPSTSHGASYADVERLEVLERLRLLHRDAYRMDATRLRYRERVIEIGATITVLGAGMLEPDPDTSRPALYRQGQPLRLRFSGTSPSPLVIRAERQ